MLRFLFPQIKWRTIKAVGFDLDGTLYDEVEFIAQVHWTIAQYIASRCDNDARQIYSDLLCSWFEKGSSYGSLFSDIVSQNGICGEDAVNTIYQCVKIFRNFKPNLVLPTRTSWLLNHLIKLYPLFLITDGSSTLQMSKIESLGLKTWFSASNIGISGDYGKNYQKPSTDILSKVEIMSQGFHPSEIVYFGDREVDRAFAAKAGFGFVKTHCLKAICDFS